MQQRPAAERKFELKAAHSARNGVQIDAAMEKINAAWQAASQEMYQAQQQAGGANPGQGQGCNGGDCNGNGNGGCNNGNCNNNQKQGGADNVTDVDYEEVK